MGAGALNAFGDQFTPAFQRSGQSFLQDRRAQQAQQLQREIFERRLADVAEQRQLEKGKALAQQAALEEQAVKDDAAINQAAKDGRVTPEQAAALFNLPLGQRGQALREVTGVLSPGPSQKELAEIANIQARTNKANAETGQVGVTEIMRNLAAANIPIDSPEGRAILEAELTGSDQGKAAAAVAADVRIKELAAGDAKAIAAQDKEFAAEIAELEGIKSNLLQIRSLAPDAATGSFAETRTAISKLASEFGFEDAVEKINSFTDEEFIPTNPVASELIGKVIAETVLKMKEGAKGVQTDSDQVVIERAAINQSDTLETMQRKVATNLALFDTIIERKVLANKLSREGMSLVEANRAAVEQIPTPSLDLGGGDAGGSLSPGSVLKFDAEGNFLE